MTEVATDRNPARYDLQPEWLSHIKIDAETAVASSNDRIAVANVKSATAWRTVPGASFVEASADYHAVLSLVARSPSREDLEKEFATRVPAAAHVTHLLAVDDPDVVLRLLAFADDYDPAAERSFWQALTTFEKEQGIEASAFYGVWNDAVADSLAGVYRSLR